MHPIIQVLIAVLVLVAGTYDILYRRIPNWLVLPCWLIGFAVNAALAQWLGQHWIYGLKTAAFGFVLAMVVYMPLYMLRGMGAGDVKLMAAIGALGGPVVWLLIFIFSGLVGGIVAVALMLYHRRFSKTIRNIVLIAWDMLHFRPPYGRAELNVSNPKSMRLPYGAIVALGALAFLGARPLLG